MAQTASLVQKKWRLKWREHWDNSSRFDQTIIILRALLATATFGMIIADWFYGLSLISSAVHKNNVFNYYYTDGNTYSMYYFAFFTIQSNLLCVLYFWGLSIWPWLEGKKKIFSHNMNLAIAVYITVTFIVYNLVLLPVAQPTNAWGWIFTAWAHMLQPILFVLYFLLYSPVSKPTTYWRTSFRVFPKVLIYPLAWLAFTIIRGFLIKWKNFIAFHYHLPNGFQYFSYFFLDLTSYEYGIPGWVWFIISFIVLFWIFFGLTMLYNYLTNKRYYRYQRLVSLKDKLTTTPAPTAMRSNKLIKAKKANPMGLKAKLAQKNQVKPKNAGLKKPIFQKDKTAPAPTKQQADKPASTKPTTVNKDGQ